MREGFVVEGGELVPLQTDIIGTADHTLIYPDKRLLARLLTAYPNLYDMSNVLVIRPDQLDEWRRACTTVVLDKGLPVPE